MKKVDLNKLKKIWYKKLKKSGFEDIERDEYSLKYTTSNALFSKHGRIRTGTHVMIQEYYYMAEHFLNSYTFASERDRVIWNYHTNGLSNDNIAKTLKKARIKKCGRWTVWRIINELKEIMFKEMKARINE
jgi:hypothetical protein